MTQDPSAPHPGEANGYPDRQPTTDPNLYIIPRDQLPAGFAAAVERGDVAATPPRPASTIVLVRDSAAGPEALLLLRHGGSGFAANAWVFPGGTIDEADLDPALPVLCDGPSPDEWQERLGIDSSLAAFAHVAAAIREAFEETGILLAREGVGANRELRERGSPAALVQCRNELLAGRLHLRELAVRTGMQLATDELIYLAHWITPEAEPRRFDTRFFLAPVPDGAECQVHQPELIEARWLAPAAAVEAFQVGDMKMLPPTVHTLQRLAPFANVREMQAGLRGAAVATILPRMRPHRDGIAIDIAEK